MKSRIVIVALVMGLLAVPCSGSEDGGMAIYDRKCAMCHGKDGVAKAMAKGSANLNDPEWQRGTSVDRIVQVVTEGKGKMPKYEEKLSPDEIKLVSTYVLTLAPPE